MKRLDGLEDRRPRRLPRGVVLIVTNSFFRLAKKLSVGALSQQFPRRYPKTRRDDGPRPSPEHLPPVGWSSSPPYSSPPPSD